MRPAAILGLLSDLYTELMTAQERISELEARLAELERVPHGNGAPNGATPSEPPVTAEAPR